MSTRSKQACTLVIVRYRVALETNIRHGQPMYCMENSDKIAIRHRRAQRSTCLADFLSSLLLSFCGSLSPFLAWSSTVSLSLSLSLAFGRRQSLFVFADPWSTQEEVGVVRSLCIAEVMFFGTACFLLLLDKQAVCNLEKSRVESRQFVP